MSSLIQLRSGFYWDITDPAIFESNIDIHVIAHSLSKICRFTGHTCAFYSVAQHSVLCSFIGPKEEAFARLLHDIAESVLGDVSSPLKRLLPDYIELERKTEVVMLRHFGFEPVLKPESQVEIPNLPRSVKMADMILLATEKRDLLPRNMADEHYYGFSEIDGVAYYHGVRPLPKCIRPWSVRKSHHAFLARFYELCPANFLDRSRWQLVLKHKLLAIL